MLLKRTLIWGSVFLIFCGIMTGMWYVARQQQGVEVGGGLQAPVSAQDRARGPASASVTLIEYSDFQCPACGIFSAVLDDVLATAELKDRVRLVYRYFPLTNIHPNAFLAASAAEAAGLQGKFWEMHDVLFQEQEVWSALSVADARTKFISYAATLNIDSPRFIRDMESTSVRARITASIADGNQTGINATPTFFLNGARMQIPNSLSEFTQQIKDAVTENP